MGWLRTARLIRFPLASLLRFPGSNRPHLESGSYLVIDVYNKATNELLGSITEADLQVLVDALEEESSDDKDYYIDAATIDVIGDGRATDHLLVLLRKALGNAEGVDIRWNRR